MAKDNNWGWLLLVGVAVWWLLRPKEKEKKAAPVSPIPTPTPKIPSTPPSPLLAVPEPIIPPSTALPREPMVRLPASAEWAESGASYFGLPPGTRATERVSQDTMIFEAGIRHTGAERNVEVAIIFSSSIGILDAIRMNIWGHPDPRSLPVAQWRWATIRLPEALTEPLVTRYRLEWMLPDLPAGVYDVYRAIVEPVRWYGETYAEAVGRAVSDDWDDGVVEIIPLRWTAAPATLPPIGEA